MIQDLLAQMYHRGEADFRNVGKIMGAAIERSLVLKNFENINMSKTYLTFEITIETLCR